LKIKDIDFIDGALIIAIMRGKNIIFPTGNDEIRENDIMVVIDTCDKIRDINDILR
jgi:Trk K+ transport system NAD-binding subunit